jgi:hypothetical protein
VGIFLEPAVPCVEGALYCDGTEATAGALSGTLYRCTDGVPVFYETCSSGCTDPFEPNGVCFGGAGLCREGGTYCGGNHLDGDPNTLYVCRSFAGTDPMPCPAGCLAYSGGDGIDACK